MVAARHLSLRALVERPFVLGCVGLWSARVDYRKEQSPGVVALCGTVGSAHSTDALLGGPRLADLSRLVGNRLGSLRLGGNANASTGSRRTGLAEDERRQPRRRRFRS